MKKIKNKFGLYDVVNYTLFSVGLLLIIYPLYWIVIASISDPNAVNAGDVTFLPKGLTFAGYEKIFTFDNIISGYTNSIIYTVSGTVLNVILTLITGYALSRRDLPFKNAIFVFFLIPMYFSGGLIPTYLVVDSLGLVNTIWAMILPGALSIFNVILAKTFFQNTIPIELLESAQMDGCTNIRFLFHVAIPLSAALTALLLIYYGIGHWNAYFPALIYIRDPNKLPLQVILREILIAQTDNNEMFNMLVLQQSEMERHEMAQLIRYGIIVVASLPLLILYPFLQKYFEKGVMIGSIKG